MIVAWVLQWVPDSRTVRVLSMVKKKGDCRRGLLGTADLWNTVEKCTVNSRRRMHIHRRVIVVPVVH